MDNLLKKCAIAIAILAIGQAQGSEREESQSPYSIIMPGQNGDGGGTFIKNGVINTKNCRTYQSIGANPDVPANEMASEIARIDLGQDQCVDYFEQQYSQDPQAQSGNNLLFGVSQGTATLVHFLAKKSHAQQEQMAKGLVLESVLGSGNSAILHTVSNVPLVTYLPFARFWAPWAAKAFAFPYYKPYGQQAFSSIKQISPNIPIIMIHDQNDPQLSVNDARQAYINARKAGHQKVYLMETNCGQPRHFDLFGGKNRVAKDMQKIAALQAIYKKEGLPFTTSTQNNNQNATHGATDLTPMMHKTNITDYQPSVEEVQKRIDKSTRCSFWARNAIDTLACAGIASHVYYKYLKKASCLLPRS